MACFRSDSGSDGNRSDSAVVGRLRALKAAGGVHVRLTADQLDEFKGYYFMGEIATLIYATYGDQGEWQAAVDRPSYVRLFGTPHDAE